MKYQHILFDLDHTLWDFHTNSMITLRELFRELELKHFFKDFDLFFNLYEENNLRLWSEYRKGLIGKKELNFQRFYYPFKVSGYDEEELARKFAGEYVKRSPLKTELMPGAVEILEYLKPKYNLHIITNGFLEVQDVKLKKSGLDKYFERVFISELIGVQKPDVYFFEYVVKSLNASKKECMVIGDSYEADIIGAKNFGLDHIFYNSTRKKHNNSVMYEISHLTEIKDIL
ncbi:MAG: noncanonical pyrimidine nucleotidase, YjjG family [Chlorobi bacterium]|nr:noncanonical pyrimidine nucleotidase, YjjG family [Chlorobiota bacterium]